MAGSGLAGGTITTTGTVSLGTQAASSLLGNPGTAVAVPSAVVIGSGLSLATNGTLTATGSGGSVTSVVAGGGLSGGTITSTGTLAADWNAGTVTTIGDGLNLNSGTLVARQSYAGTLTAAGSDQATALTLTADLNVLTTVAAATGVRLKLTPSAGFVQQVVNRGSNSALVYPAASATIEALAVNVAATVVAGGTARFIADSTTQWYAT